MLVSDVPVKLITAVLVAAVTVVGEITPTREELDVAVPEWVPRVSVTPDGIPLNVMRICVELSTATPLLLFWAAVLQQLEQPSVKINAPAALATLPFVKIVAVPAGLPPVTLPIVVLPGARPMAKAATPAFKLLITVPVDGEPSR